MAFKASSVTPGTKQRILSIVRRVGPDSFDKIVATIGEDQFLDAIVGTANSLDDTSPAYMREVHTLLKEDQRAETRKDVEVICALFLSTAVFAVLFSVTTAYFGITPDHMNDHEWFGNALLVMIAISLITAAGILLQIGALPSCMVGVVLWFFAVYGFTRSVAYTTGGVRAWWHWLAGHF